MINNFTTIRASLISHCGCTCCQCNTEEVADGEAVELLDQAVTETAPLLPDTLQSGPDETNQPSTSDATNKTIIPSSATTPYGTITVQIESAVDDVSSSLESDSDIEDDRGTASPAPSTAADTAGSTAVDQALDPVTEADPCASQLSDGDKFIWLGFSLLILSSVLPYGILRYQVNYIIDVFLRCFQSFVFFSVRKVNRQYNNLFIYSFDAFNAMK